MKPFEQTGTSANITFYAQTHRAPTVAYWWCEVLYGAWERDADGHMQLRRRPVYYFTLRRNLCDVEIKFKYEPKRWPRSERLSGARVTQLVRAHLNEKGAE